MASLSINQARDNPMIRLIDAALSFGFVAAGLYACIVLVACTAALLERI